MLIWGNQKGAAQKKCSLISKPLGITVLKFIFTSKVDIVILYIAGKQQIIESVETAS